MDKSQQEGLFPSKKPKNNKGKKIFNIRAVKEKKYVSVFDTDKAKAHPKTEYWKKILGDMEGRCTITVYGRSGSGKSVFVLQLADYLSQVYGKAVYDSHEERVNKTLANRIKNFNITSTTLWITDSGTFDELCERIQKMYLRVVIIDSVQYARFTKAQLQELQQRFAKRSIIWVLVSFGTAEGKTRGADDLLHASDIKLYVHKGELSVTNRYLDKKAKITLFNPELSTEIEDDDFIAPTLFDTEATDTTAKA